MSAPIDLENLKISASGSGSVSSSSTRESRTRTVASTMTHFDASNPLSRDGVHQCRAFRHFLRALIHPLAFSTTFGSG